MNQASPKFCGMALQIFKRLYVDKPMWIKLKWVMGDSTSSARKT